MPETKTIFLSYARKDGEKYVQRLDAELPYRTWYDQRGIDPTQDFSSEIENAIQSCDVIVVCVTSDVRREDSFVRREIAYALLMKKPVLIARFEDVPPPIMVVNNTWVDFFNDWDAGFGNLLSYLQGTINALPNTRQPDDPYHNYLNMLYKYVVHYLRHTVSSRLITLSAEARPDSVDTAVGINTQVLPVAYFDMTGNESSNDDSGQAYENFHKAFDNYEGRLLLLGDPGAGKTTTLIAFARDMIIRRLADLTQPLPIVATIATWNAQKRTSLIDWLSEQNLSLEAGLPRIVEEGQALLLLDGLDELGDESVVRDEGDRIVEQYDPPSSLTGMNCRIH